MMIQKSSMMTQKSSMMTQKSSMMTQKSSMMTHLDLILTSEIVHDDPEVIYAKVEGEDSSQTEKESADQLQTN